jgi:hypothetical protein
MHLPLFIIFQLINMANKYRNSFYYRDGATRELINALKQPTTHRIYKDLIHKLESTSVPNSPSTPDSSGKTYVFKDVPGGGVKPDKIGTYLSNSFV